MHMWANKLEACQNIWNVCKRWAQLKCSCIASSGVPSAFLRQTAGPCNHRPPRTACSCCQAHAGMPDVCTMLERTPLQVCVQATSGAHAGNRNQPLPPLTCACLSHPSRDEYLCVMHLRRLPCSCHKSFRWLSSLGWATWIPVALGSAFFFSHCQWTHGRVQDADGMR